jgi:endonuclease/exonuclease/phosphatase family metal-dependent hydrolase
MRTWKRFSWLVASLSVVFVAKAQVREGEWTLATFNIRYDNPSDPISWEARRNDVANLVGFYDIVGLQEALPHQIEDVAQRLPWMSHVGEGRDVDGGGEACPIFYNHTSWELLHHETLWLAPEWKKPGAIGWSADLPRIVTVGWFHHKKSGKRVRVYNTHWSHISEEARRASAELIASIDAIHGVEATAVLGDFNEEAEGEGRQVLVKAGFVDTYDDPRVRCRKTFPSYTTFQPAGAAGGPKIDAVYVKGLKAQWTCVDEVIKNEVFISDHLPVHAVVSWASKGE